MRLSTKLIDKHLFRTRSKVINFTLLQQTFPAQLSKKSLKLIKKILLSRPIRVAWQKNQWFCRVGDVGIGTLLWAFKFSVYKHAQ